MSKRKVAYDYDTGSKFIAEVGAYTYGLGHPIKPHRIHVTHDLVSAYGMLDKTHVLVSCVLGLCFVGLCSFDQDKLHLRK
ncbi:hypothetical protein BJ165DRAFT_1484231, partial [Panaeolus papilionaceus]